MKNHKKMKGFTLAELLIVLAIIAILAAIAIPIFTVQLDAARKRVDEANARTACTLAEANYLMYHSGEKDLTYRFTKDGNGIALLSHVGVTNSESDCPLCVKTGEEATKFTGEYNKGVLTVNIKDGTITTSWEN